MRYPVKRSFQRFAKKRCKNAGSLCDSRIALLSNGFKLVLVPFKNDYGSHDDGVTPSCFLVVISRYPQLPCQRVSDFFVIVCSAVPPPWLLLEVSRI